MLQIPTFVANLSKTVKEEETKITNSSLTISTIVDILINVANTIQVADVSQDVIQASKTESLKEKKDTVLYLSYSVEVLIFSIDSCSAECTRNCGCHHK